MTIGNKLKKKIIDYIFKPIETKKNSSGSTHDINKKSE